MADFSGKRYVVTGAASGIGHAVAQRLLATGADVHCLDRNTPTAAVTQHVEVDLANPRSIDAAVEQLDGRFDGLIQVAGIPDGARGSGDGGQCLAVRYLTESFFDKLVPGAAVTVVVLDRRLRLAAATGRDSRPAGHRQLRGGRGLVQGQPEQGNAYNFSKEVTTVYAMSMALALHARGFRINAVLPGPVETPILSIRGYDGQGHARRGRGSCLAGTPIPTTSPRWWCFWPPMTRAGSMARPWPSTGDSPARSRAAFCRLLRSNRFLNRLWIGARYSFRSSSMRRGRQLSVRRHR